MTDTGTVQRARPKYQVFISSTWDDLKEIRAKVTWEVLAAGHIPAGMENFPATDERGWDIIRRTIDRSDYYLIIVAGRYGTYDPTIERSWTHREYEYARSKGIPVLAFIRDRDQVPASHLDNDEADRKRLAEFIAMLSGTHLKKTWTTQDDLATKAVQALRAHIDNDEEDGKPRPGWYRGDQIPTSASIDEFARLSAENAELKARVIALNEVPQDILYLKPADGVPLANRKWRTTTLTVHEPNVLTFGGTLTAMQKFALQVANTFWVNIAVGNAGALTAEAVVVDLSVTGAIGVVREAHIVPGSGAAFEQEPTDHCIAEMPRISNGQASVRLRVRQINARDTERLFPIGFTVAPATEEAVVTCLAKSSNGGESSINFTVSRLKEGTKTIEPNDLIDLARAQPNQ